MGHREPRAVSARRPTRPGRLDADRTLTIALGVALALALGAVGFTATRVLTAPGPVAVTVAGQTAAPAAAEPEAIPPDHAEDPAEAVPASAPDAGAGLHAEDPAPPTPARPTGPDPTAGPSGDVSEPAAAIRLTPGDPAGSGCTPGPGPLPDGQWVGHIVSSAGSSIRFDLVCYDSATREVRNDNPVTREVPVGDGATVWCSGAMCVLRDVAADALVLIQVSGDQLRAARILS